MEGTIGKQPTYPPDTPLPSMKVTDIIIGHRRPNTFASWPNMGKREVLYELIPGSGWIKRTGGLHSQEIDVRDADVVFASG